MIEVACELGSLNHGDAFILDAGESIYVWRGEDCSPFEASMANQAAEALESTRDGKSTTTQDVDDAFWEALGGPGARGTRPLLPDSSLCPLLGPITRHTRPSPIDSAAAMCHSTGDVTAAADAASGLPTPIEKGEGVLYQLDDSSGELEMSEVGRGELTRDMLTPTAVYLCDTGPEILVWIGSEASARESAAAMDTANKYMSQTGKPFTTPVSVLKEGFGLKNKLFAEIFSQ